MPKLYFLSHVLGVPAGDRETTITFNKGEVATVTDEQFRIICAVQTRSYEAVAVLAAEGLQTVRCRPCRKVFALDNMMAHRVLFHAAKQRETFVCFEPGCGNPYETVRGLQIHQSKACHGPYKDKPRVPCQSCDETFPSHNAKARHRAEHHPPKPRQKVYK